jgi:hypothetical protein
MRSLLALFPNPTYQQWLIIFVIILGLSRSRLQARAVSGTEQLQFDGLCVPCETCSCFLAARVPGPVGSSSCFLYPTSAPGRHTQDVALGSMMECSVPLKLDSKQRPSVDETEVFPNEQNLPELT